MQEFEWQLEPNIFALHRELQKRVYKHGRYSAFMIRDPKQRRIHKATVRDRILHHSMFSILNPIFEPTFISHSFSCRKGKGTHKAIEALDGMLRRVSSNGYKQCFALKCDIHQFFASVDHEVLLNILDKKIKDPEAIDLLREIVGSFSSVAKGKGIPIGNLTSQLFANVYLNEFDQFIKHDLKIKNFIRYTDDFVIVASDPMFLQSLISPIQSFLENQLRLSLHPKKIIIRKFRQGIDFLGYVLLPHHRLLRTKTRRRMFRKLRERIKQHKDGNAALETAEQSLHSYTGVLSHANAHRLSEDLRNQYWFWLGE